VERRCNTCVKLWRGGQACRVLTELIGLNEDCWAWSDDPNWWNEYRKVVRRYRREWLKRHVRRVATTV